MWCRGSRVRIPLATPFYAVKLRGGMRTRVYTKDWGLGIFICLLGVNLSALSDDTESVVVEVFKSVGSSLYEFHFPVEAFSDTVVLSKSPHADDRFYPLG